MSLVDRLKKRWKIESTFQVFVILVVFACTGFTSLYVRELLFGLMGIEESDPVWFRIIMWLLTVLPAYNLLLLIYGFIFGQFEFFWNFFKKTIGRLVPKMNSSGS